MLTCCCVSCFEILISMKTSHSTRLLVASQGYGMVGFKILLLVSVTTNMLLCLQRSSTSVQTITAPVSPQPIPQAPRIHTHNSTLVQPVTRKRTIFGSSLDSIEDLAHKISSRQDFRKACKSQKYGKGWGGHALCQVTVNRRPCYFYSFGISHDFSFDAELAEQTGCYGFSADPTVTHPAVLPGTNGQVIFTHMAAKSYREDHNLQWMFVTSVPGLRRWQGHNKVEVLKMDCEGCEYSLARDILAEDPAFFSHIGQFAVEVHYSRTWLRGTEELYSLATLLDLLTESGMELIHAVVTSCNPRDEASGVLPELQAKPGLRLTTGHCHNYLFARLPKTAESESKPL